jgi:iron complex outermembrane receptor protein
MRSHLRIALLVLLVLYKNLCSQSHIAGKIVDSLAKPVPFCAAGLYKQIDSSLVKGTLSDEGGNFVFENIAGGAYYVRIRHPGFAMFRYSFNLDSHTILKTPPFILKHEGLVLKEVGITTIKDPLEFRNGNITMNVENSPLTAGNSVYDLLARMPGVLVDNDNISIQGKSGVKLYMDDRQQPFSGLQLVNFLKSTPASSVEKVEIILHPPARYDAAGNAGLIHIHSKKLKLTGSSGSINATLSQGYYANGNGGFSLNYKGQKLTLFSSVNAEQGRKHYVDDQHRTLILNGQSRTLYQKSTEESDNRNQVLNLGADWYAGKKTTIGFKLQVIPGYALSQLGGSILYSDTGRQLGYHKTQTNDWLMNNYNLNAEHRLDTLGSKLSLSADYYGPYVDNYKGMHVNRFYDPAGNPAAILDFKTSNSLSSQIATARLDLEKKMPGNLTVGAGIKGSYQEVQSDYVLARKDASSGDFYVDSAYTNAFRYREKIGAAYLNLEKKFRRLDLQAGLRAENTSLQAALVSGSTNYSRSYFNLFPTLNAGFEVSKKHRLSFSYDKRIYRPNYSNLNPSPWFNNLFSGNQGNPYVRPAYTHNCSMNYVYNSSVYNNLGFSRTNDLITYYSDQNNSTGQLIYRIGNIRLQQYLYYSFFIRKNIVSWWTLSFNFGTYYIFYGGTFNGLEYSGFRIPHYEWTNSVFLLPKNFKLEVTAFYWGPWLAVGSNYEARGSLSLGLKKTLLKDALTCSVSLNDVFFTETWRSSSDFANQSWQHFESYDTRRLNLGLSYTFGKIKAEQRQTESSEEEKKRLGK